MESKGVKLKELWVSILWFREGYNHFNKLIKIKIMKKTGNHLKLVPKDLQRQIMISLKPRDRKYNEQSKIQVQKRDQFVF